MSQISRWFVALQDFFALCKSLDDAYIRTVTKKNAITLTVAAALTLVLEGILITSLFIRHPAVDTPASKIYLMFYLSLVGLSLLLLGLQPLFLHNTHLLYWLQILFVAGYLLWNVLLNSYDLYRNGRGSSLALIMAIIFASILVHFRPSHIMTLQIFTYLLFFSLNHGRIEDTINATIAVTVTVTANILFYHQEIRGVQNRQQVIQMNAQLEKERLDGAAQYLRRLRDAQTQTAIYHHDLRHTLNLAEQLSLQGDVEKLQSFLSSSQETLVQLTPTFYCDHETVNLILGSFDQRARERNVTFETDVHLPTHLPLQDTELCSLLFNLLENALHGAEKVADSSPRHIYPGCFQRQSPCDFGEKSLCRSNFDGERPPNPLYSNQTSRIWNSEYRRHHRATPRSLSLRNRGTALPCQGSAPPLTEAILLKNPEGVHCTPPGFCVTIETIK